MVGRDRDDRDDRHRAPTGARSGRPSSSTRPPARCSSSMWSAGTRRRMRCGRPRARYLAPLKEKGIDTLILGCTHYPLLSGLLQLELGPDVVLVSSAEETREGRLRRASSGWRASAMKPTPPHHEFLTTGDAEPFRDLAELFLGRELGAGQGRPPRSRAVAREALGLGFSRNVAGNSGECSGYLVTSGSLPSLARRGNGHLRSFAGARRAR